MRVGLGCVSFNCMGDSVNGMCVCCVCVEFGTDPMLDDGALILLVALVKSLLGGLRWLVSRGTAGSSVWLTSMC